MRFGVRAVSALCAAILIGCHFYSWAAEPRAAEEKSASPEVVPLWTAKRIFDAFRNESRCVVETPAATIDDGRQETTVLLRVDARSLSILTESNVDMGHADVGIQVDDHKLIKPDRTFLDQHLQFESPIGQVIEQFKAGLAVEARLRFWPTWPDKGLKNVRFSLVGFTRAFARLPGC